MSFGSQTVTFVTISKGALDANNIPAKVRTEVPVPGCRFRPLSSTEKLGVFDVATQVWKCTAPPVQAVLDATSISELRVRGVRYQVVGGDQPFNDFGPDVFKVTVLCQMQSV